MSQKTHPGKDARIPDPETPFPKRAVPIGHRFSFLAKKAAACLLRP
jgi:hypothetical protein